MSGRKDEKQLPPDDASDVSPAAPKQAANAVQTPPPSRTLADSEAPTLLQPISGIAPPKHIDEAHPSDAPTLLDARVRTAARPASNVNASNWGSPSLLPTGSILSNRYEILELLGEGGM